MHKKMKLGIMSALHEEQQGLVERMQTRLTVSHGMRTYTEGNLWGVDTVCVLSRIGKVAAAMSATMLIERFGVTHILFTGVAGAGNSQVGVGDIVIAESLVQYDMDASPLFPPHQIPLTGISHFPSDSVLSNQLYQAAERFCVDKTVQLHRGLIASGDQFINEKQHIDRLAVDLPGLLAVEMEGAAVAQVCFELACPFAVVRTISDNANEEAATDFMHFVKTVASHYTYGIVEQLCLIINDSPPVLP
jgi:adenosylhomocysteine nucleosidase